MRKLVGAVGIEPKTHHRWNNRFKTFHAVCLRLVCLLNLEALTVYKIIYGAVDEKPEIAWK